MPGEQTEDFLKVLLPNQKRIFSYIATLIPNHADAEDIMQNVVALLWRKFSDYTPETDFVAWALATARYKVYEYYKEIKRGQRKLSNETVRMLEKEAVSSGDSHNQYLETVKKCVQKLAAKDYKLIQLRYELNENIKNIAARFGCSVQSIYKSFARIHCVLLRCVNRELNHEITS